MWKVSPLVFVHHVGEPPPTVSAEALALAQIPSTAFGDGSHPTTRLCAGAVDLLCRVRRPRAVLDVGTGTGLLARVARARGVPLVVGTDNDPAALDAARANAALDRLAGEIRIADRPPDAWGPRFDLVVANILEAVLLELADALVAALAPGGRLLLSGFTPAQSPALRAAFLGRGLRLEVQAALEDWVLLDTSRP